ncbi:MAG TPA: Ig-like domain-containing protein [Longimicrobiales bacterium]|nr:Ig-like domain-containing protein [Longimicrobiales bacterium]
MSVQPAGGAANVMVGDSVVVRFDHAMATGMEAYAALHEGSVAGPLVTGTWGLSGDRTTLTFVPASPLKPSTTYVIHLGGAMRDGNGNVVNLDMHGMGMGGQWATQSMMGGGMSGGGMMGAGWQHPTNGSYGMLFTFTTGTGPDGVTSLSGMQPMGGAVDVAVGTTVVVTFSHAIADGMEAYAALLEGSLAGPDVAGVWSLSEDRMVLTFEPAAPLKAATTYLIQLGGAMMDADGDLVDLATYGMGMGGQWATQSMMGGMGGGMGGQTGTHMGPGWQHPSNGSYGMVFSFTTAA